MENIEESLMKRACELSTMSVEKGCGPLVVLLLICLIISYLKEIIV